MNSKGKVFLIDDEKVVRLSLKRELQKEGYEVEDFELAEKVLPHISADWPGVLITDVMMPDSDGFNLMGKVNAIDPEIPVILITGQGDIPMAVDAIRKGAYDFLEKPFATEEFLDATKRAMEKRSLVMEVRRLNSKIDNDGDLQLTMIGKSPVMERLRQVISSVADSDADILLLGETGTGKDLAAQSIHNISGRKKHNFTAINCGAMPESIIESELFGHEAGSFTGANRQRIGKFEYANKGTVYLDEIESMPLHLQVKLLRVIQERFIGRVGSNEKIPLDIRIIAATKCDLKAASDQNLFRKDLYYRLNVVEITLPPLRQHKEDIPFLFQHFVMQGSARYNQPKPQIPSPQFMQELQLKDWEGNIRELKNEADKFVLGLTQVSSEKFPAQAFTNILPESKNGKNGGNNLNSQLEAIEKNLIAQELTRNKGNIKKTYTNLGLSRQTLYNRLGALGLKRRDFI